VPPIFIQRLYNCVFKMVRKNTSLNRFITDVRKRLMY